MTLRLDNTANPRADFITFMKTDTIEIQGYTKELLFYFGLFINVIDINELFD